jgi:TatD DNase family protein
VVAVGETGLDGQYAWSPLEVQRPVFERHVALAAAAGKPLIIHCRRAASEVLEVLDAATARLRGLQHCFSEDEQYARRVLDLGLYISFTGILTRDGYKRLKRAAALTPADRLLLETDCPYMTPVGAPARRNEPAFLPRTLDALAAIRGEDPSDLARQTSANAARLFGFRDVPSS